MNDDRRYWLGVAERLATPVLENLAARRFKDTMPVESAPGAVNREQFSHLEALGRLLMGLAPWLELGPDTDAEGLQRALRRSPDRMNFSEGQQPLVDAAFLALALLRAPRELWEKLDDRVRGNLVAALRETHHFQPAKSNWVLFVSTVEAAFRRFGVEHDAGRLAAGLHDHEQWYVGDGTYGDGPHLHWDYYKASSSSRCYWRAWRWWAGTRSGKNSPPSSKNVPRATPPCRSISSRRTVATP